MSDVNNITGNKVISLLKEKFCNEMHNEEQTVKN